MTRLIGGRRIVKTWIQMRVRRNTIRKIHALAKNEKRSDQGMLNVLVAEALKARGVVEE